jgi:hypothetical protein
LHGEYIDVSLQSTLDLHYGWADDQIASERKRQTGILRGTLACPHHAISTNTFRKGVAIALQFGSLSVELHSEIIADVV